MSNYPTNLTEKQWQVIKNIVEPQERNRKSSLSPGDNPPVGIVLCAEKNDAVVKYTLPEGDNQIFAAKYMTYMPTQEEIRQLLCEDDNL